VSFPESLITETPTPVAAEILTLLSDLPVSEGLRLWLSHLRGDYRNARDQESLFGRES
jgi:hypothetical protein